jgi:hypothetical protein
MNSVIISWVWARFSVIFIPLIDQLKLISRLNRHEWKHVTMGTVVCQHFLSGHPGGIGPKERRREAGRIVDTRSSSLSSMMTEWDVNFTASSPIIAEKHSPG